MNRHALTVLQFPEALDQVARYASSPLGAEAVRALEPTDALAWVEPELRRVEQMVAFLLRNENWSVPTLPDLRGALRRLGLEGSVWDGPELWDAAVLIRSARGTRRAVLRYAQDYPLLAALAERLTKVEGEAEAIDRAIDGEGAVRNDASRELGRLRREARAVRARMVERLEAHMAALPERMRVPDASVSLRDGRYVIAVRREGRAAVGGIVHDESSTGATLFIEPPIAIELMNRLRELELAEAREVQRILRALTDRLRPHRAALEASLSALIQLDSLYARARYALHSNGSRPELLPPGAEDYAVVAAHHPLLLAGSDPVVPFDLRLEPSEHTLLVSGPNTGGKTVLLKAIGLISTLAQAGVIPPVGRGTRLPLFRNIFADIGDEQSIEASLSTFSAHLRNLREIVDEADHESLALIDEIGSGTDPAEGGALAQGVLVELTRRATLTVATTHLGQLKLLAGAEPGVVNASLQFDSRELKPTYRLIKGLPGRSYGLAIARRLGFDAAVLERSEGFLAQGEREVGQLLAELEEKDRRMADALADTEAARRETAELRRTLEERQHAVRKRERDAERRARQQARDLLLGAREEVERAIRELRDTDAAEADGVSLEERAREARRKVEQAARRQAERTPGDVSPLEEAAEVDAADGGPARAGRRPLRPGSRVRIAATGAVGIVAELRDGRATVETAGLRLQVPVGGLVVLEQAEEARAAGRATAPGGDTHNAPGAGWSGPDIEASPEIDLRGLRADEVQARLEPALDAALQAGLASLRIIHGKGTGALRDVVAELLQSVPHVRSARPGGVGEGGTGVTIAELE